MNKYFFSISLILACITALISCSPRESANTVKIGVIAGPEADLMTVAKIVAAERFNLTVKIVSFSDYNTPNRALEEGSIDANMFQHQPYLDASNKAHHFNLVPIAKTFIYPMAIYSKSIAHIKQIPTKAIVAIPNDPSNAARALLLLQKAKLIQLKENASANASLLDIIANLKQLTIKSLDAAQLPRVLADVDLAVINTNYAIPAGLFPKRDALLTEGIDSLYSNLIVVRQQDRQNNKIHRLIQAIQSPEVAKKAQSLFAGQAIKMW